MTRRTKSHTVPGPSGELFTTIGKQTTSQLVSDERITEDVLPGNGHYLVIKKITNDGGLINYRHGQTDYTGGVWHNVQPSRLRSFSSDIYHHLVNDSRPTNEEAATQLVKATNPSRPIVDLPVFIAELRDIPQLIKLSGDTLLKKSASANLSYQFGWKPLISDLNKLLDFQSHFANREKELKALFTSGLRRKRLLWRGTSEFKDPGHVIHTGILTWHANVTKRTSIKTTGFVKWKSTHAAPVTNAEMQKLARKAVLGLTIDPATAWELIPFSWLVDWCTSAGDYLMAHRNIVGAKHDTVQIMTLLETTMSWPAHRRNSMGGFASYNCKIVNKQRSPTALASLNAHLPFLSLRQLSILGSIGVLSGRTGKHIR